MFKIKKQKKITSCNSFDTAGSNAPAAGQTLFKTLEENVALFKDLFNNDETFLIRYFENHKNSNIKLCALFIDGMVKTEIVNEYVIKPIMVSTSIDNSQDIFCNIFNHVLESNNVEKSSDSAELVQAIVVGDTVLLMEDCSEAIIVSSKGWKSRAIEEPDSEKNIRGSREGFTESLLENLSMIRRKLATNNLKFKFRKLGVQSGTKVCIAYIDGISNGQILAELNKRLDTIDIDGILATGTITELIKDAPLSPFKTIGSTERPDVIAARLLEGRIALLIEGSPIAITVPHVFIESFQSNEDYYINFYFSSVNRLIRFLSFLLSISMPAVYVSLTTFHQEMLPTPLIRSISAARQSVPLPTVIEILLLLLTFEILREAGTRMPSNIGQALSIVGALVLGQAAVEARFVSSPVVIIVALTAITSLGIPKLNGVLITTRLILLFFSSILGLYGYMFGMIGLAIHLLELRSFGVPYMLGLINITKADLLDTAIRAPWQYMKYRPKFITSNNRIRMNNRGTRK